MMSAVRNRDTMLKEHAPLLSAQYVSQVPSEKGFAKALYKALLPLQLSVWLVRLFIIQPGPQLHFKRENPDHDPHANVDILSIKHSPHQPRHIHLHQTGPGRKSPAKF